MRKVADSDNAGRAAAVAQENIPDVEVRPASSPRKAGNGKQSSQSERRTSKAQDYDEAESLVLEMRDLRMIEINPRASYQMTPDLTRRVIQNMVDMKMKTRNAIFTAVWSYFGYLNTEQITLRVSLMADIIESMIRDD